MKNKFCKIKIVKNPPDGYKLDSEIEVTYKEKEQLKKKSARMVEIGSYYWKEEIVKKSPKKKSPKKKGAE